MSLRFWGLFLGTTSHQGAMPFPHEMTRHSKRLTPLLSTEGLSHALRLPYRSRAHDNAVGSPAKTALEPPRLRMANRHRLPRPYRITQHKRIATALQKVADAARCADFFTENLRNMDGWKKISPREKHSTSRVENHSEERVAGVAGFEPAHGDTKNRCLTAWLHPKISRNIRNPFRNINGVFHKMSGKCQEWRGSRG